MWMTRRKTAVVVVVVVAAVEVSFDVVVDNIDKQQLVVGKSYCCYQGGTFVAAVVEAVVDNIHIECDFVVAVVVVVVAI